MQPSLLSGALATTCLTRLGAWSHSPVPRPTGVCHLRCYLVRPITRSLSLLLSLGESGESGESLSSSLRWYQWMELSPFGVCNHSFLSLGLAPIQGSTNTNNLFTSSQPTPPNPRSTIPGQEELLLEEKWCFALITFSPKSFISALRYWGSSKGPGF